MRSSCARQNSPINWKLDSKNISCRQHSDLFSKNCKKYCVTPPYSGSDQQLAPFDPIAHLLRVLYLGAPWINSQSTLGNPDLSWGEPRVHQGCVTLWRWTTWRLQTIQYTVQSQINNSQMDMVSSSFLSTQLFYHDWAIAREKSRKEGW